MNSSQKALAVTIMIFLVGGSVSAYAWMWNERPIVDYYMSGADGTPLPTTYASYASPLVVYLAVDNRGDIDASLNLIVTVTNANITNSNPMWLESNGTQAIIGLTVQSHSSYGYVSVNIAPIGNPSNFTISYSVIDVHDWSIPSGLIDHIGGIEFHAYSPLMVTYNEIDTNVYQLKG